MPTEIRVKEHHSWITKIFIIIGVLALVAIAVILYAFYLCACGSQYYYDGDKTTDYTKDKCYSEYETCSENYECCNGCCYNGMCALEEKCKQETPCLDTDIACFSHDSCCSGFCKEGKCYKEPDCQTEKGACGLGYSLACCADLNCKIRSDSTAGICEKECFTAGIICTSDTECCSGYYCISGVCKTPPVCKAASTACQDSTECCSGCCKDGKCDTSSVCTETETITPSCIAMDKVCETDTDCCSGKCSSGICASA